MQDRPQQMNKVQRKNNWRKLGPAGREERMEVGLEVEMKTRQADGRKQRYTT